MNWFYIDGPHRLGPFSEGEWVELVQSGKVGATTLVWHEGLPGWVPFSDLPSPPPVPPPARSDADAEGEQSAEPESPKAFAARTLARDYEVPILAIIGEGWRLMFRHYAMMTGAMLLVFAVMLLGMGLPGINVFMAMGLQGVFFGGLYTLYLRLIRGEPARIRDLLAGFRGSAFRNLSLQTFIAFLVSEVSFLPLTLASKSTGVTMANLEQQLEANPQNVMIMLLTLLVCSIPPLFLSFCWMFAVPLIVDKGLPFWSAMELSRKRVFQHPWRVGMLSTLAGLAACLGLFFTFPASIAATLLLYERLFSMEETPEPPSTRRDA